MSFLNIHNFSLQLFRTEIAGLLKTWILGTEDLFYARNFGLVIRTCKNTILAQYRFFNNLIYQLAVRVPAKTNRVKSWKKCSHQFPNKSHDNISCLSLILEKGQCWNNWVNNNNYLLIIINQSYEFIITNMNS